MEYDIPCGGFRLDDVEQRGKLRALPPADRAPTRLNTIVPRYLRSARQRAQVGERQTRRAFDQAADLEPICRESAHRQRLIFGRCAERRAVAAGTAATGPHR